MAEGGLTLQDLIKRRQAGGFVGRRQELGQFEENLRLPVVDRRRRFLFSVHGDAGVGKSFMLNQLDRIAGEQGCVTAYVDESVFDIPAVLAGIVRSFARQGDPCKEFTRKSELYYEKRHELDADPATPDGLSSVLTRSAVRIGLRAAEDIPVVGSFAKELDREALAGQVEKFRAFLSVKLRNQHDVRLLMSPVEELTPVFVSELHTVAAKRPVVLFFDTFERTGSFLERWLLDLLEGRYGALPPNLLLVVAGQHPLDVNAWGDYVGIRADFPLAVFTEAEAREFLAARGITAAEVVEVVLALSGRLPVLLALLAESRPDSAASVPDPGDNAVERFLKWEKDENRKRAALRGALPRQLDRDTFALITDSTTPDEDFDWLRRLPFVAERSTGYRYHDVVRDTMIRVVRRRSSVEWRERHSALAEYYRAGRDELGLEADAGWQDERWQALAVEEHYHRLCVTGATADALAALVETAAVRADQTGRWVAMVAQAGADSGREQLIALGARLAAAEDVIALLTCLTTESALPDQARYEAHQALAMEHVRKNDFAAGAVAMTRALEHDPDDGWALTSRGIAYRVLGELEKSLADLDRAVELDPDSAWRISAHGETLHAMQRSEEALADFDRALVLEPEAADVHAARGQALYALDRYPEALVAFTRALEIEPDDTWLLGWRGRVHRQQDSYASALADATRVLELEPDADWALDERGEAHRLMGHYEEALADLTRAVEIDPRYAGAFARRGATYADMGRWAEALADYDRALEIKPSYAWALGRRALAHRDSGNPAEAMADFARALEITPEADWILADRAHTHHLAGRPAEALADYDRSIELDPEYSWAIRQRALVLRDLGRLEDALTSLTRLAEADPATAWRWSDRGAVLHRLGRFDEAVADFTRAIEADPASAQAFSRRGQSRHSLRRFDEAVADFTRATEIDPDHGPAFSQRGQIHRRCGRLAEARADLERAAQLDAEAWDHYQLGLLAHAEGRPDAAKDHFSAAVRAEAAESADGNAGVANSVLYHLALGDADEARTLFRTVLVEPAGDGEHLDGIAELEDLGSVMPVPELPEFVAALRANLHE